MLVRKLLAFTIAVLCGLPMAAEAAVVIGKVIIAEGHEQPKCRRIFLRQDSGAILTFRVPETAKEDSILAVALTALTSGLLVELSYTPGVGTGCGPEPKVEYISLKGPGV